MDYKKLQNGSDIRGVALEGIEGQHVNLTEQVCKDIGRGFALWLRKKAGKDDLRVAVGRVNYYGGWGEIFGNITGGGQPSDINNCNPTPYVPVGYASFQDLRKGMAA